MYIYIERAGVGGGMGRSFGFLPGIEPLWGFWSSSYPTWPCLVAPVQGHEPGLYLVGILDVICHTWLGCSVIHPLVHPLFFHQLLELGFELLHR